MCAKACTILSWNCSTKLNLAKADMQFAKFSYPSIRWANLFKQTQAICEQIWSRQVSFFASILISYARSLPFQPQQGRIPSLQLRQVLCCGSVVSTTLAYGHSVHRLCRAFIYIFRCLLKKSNRLVIHQLGSKAPPINIEATCYALLLCAVF